MPSRELVRELLYLGLASHNTIALVFRILRTTAKLGAGLSPMWLARQLHLPVGPRKRDGGQVSRTPVIALAVSDHDREILTGISKHEPWEMHFAVSRVEAWDAMNRLSSPLVLYDRDWPDAEWRTSVQTFASSPQRPCVILTSRVADEYLWQELIRWGGHDLLPKPLRADDATRALKLALSYWRSARATARR